MFKSSKLQLGCTALTLMLAACSGQPRTGAEAGMAMPMSEFQTHFELVDTVVLEQPDSLPIVRISGLDRASNGTWVLSDPSEGMVKLFASDGRLLQVIGAKGRGPDEFQVPEFARFDAANRIHVVDNMLQRVSVFDQAGTLVRHVPLRALLRTTDFAVLEDGTYLLAGFGKPGSQNVLFHIDSAGTIMKEFLPIGEYIPEGEQRGPSWRVVRRPSFSLDGRTATVVLSISDSVWAVNLDNGAVTSQRAAPPGYLRPFAAGRTQLRGMKDIESWTKSFTSTAEAFGTGGVLIVPFVRGLLNEGDPTTLVVRGEDGIWQALSGGPALLQSSGNEWVALHTPGADEVVLSVYRRRA